MELDRDIQNLFTVPTKNLNKIIISSLMRKISRIILGKIQLLKTFSTDVIDMV